MYDVRLNMPAGPCMGLTVESKNELQTLVRHFLRPGTIVHGVLTLTTPVEYVVEDPASVKKSAEPMDNLAKVDVGIDGKITVKAADGKEVRLGSGEHACREQILREVLQRPGLQPERRQVIERLLDELRVQAEQFDGAPVMEPHAPVVVDHQGRKLPADRAMKGAANIPVLSAKQVQARLPSLNARLAGGLGLSVRVVDMLERAGFRYVADVAQSTVRDLETIKGLGRKSMRDIRDGLESHNLRLGMKLEGWMAPVEPAVRFQQRKPRKR